MAEKEKITPVTEDEIEDIRVTLDLDSVLDERLFCSGFQNGICLRIKSADSGNSNYPKSMIGFVLAVQQMIILHQMNKLSVF